MRFPVTRIEGGRRFYPLIVLVVALSLLASACTFEVQPIEEYTSEDGYLSVTYPAAWDVIEDDSTMGMTMLGLAENPLDLDPMEIPYEAAGMFLMLMPNYVPGLEVLELDAEEFAALMVAGSAEDPYTKVGELEQVTLPNGIEAYRFWMSDVDGEGYMYAFDPVENLIAIGAIMENSESDESAVSIAEEVFGSMRFNGDVEEYSIRASEGEGFGF